MKIGFTKMHGLGNDFVLLDGRQSLPALTPELLARMANRRLGIGCDQILLIEPADLDAADIRYRVFNADGSTAEHCGNGVRCVAHYLARRGDVSGSEVRVQIGQRVFRLGLVVGGDVQVEMGVPEFAPARIPLAVPDEADRYTLEFNGAPCAFGAVSMGNPHAVFEVPEVAAAPVSTLGAFLQQHPLFPARVNVGFMQVVTPGEIHLRVHERGVGETPACGTGACGAVAVGRRWGRLGERVRVHLPGGTLDITWAGEGHMLYMTGPATHVFEGIYDA